jgi:hypothetical protein
MLAEKMMLLRPGGQALPTVVVSAKRCDLIEEEFAKPLRPLTFYN